MSAVPPEHAKWDANGDFRAVSESKCSCALCVDYRDTAHYPATPAPNNTVAGHLAAAGRALDETSPPEAHELSQALWSVIKAVEALSGNEFIE